MKRLFAALIFIISAAEIAAQSGPSLRSSLVQSGSSGIARLDWTAVPGVSRYQVRRTSTFPNNWYTFPTLYTSLWLTDSLALNAAAVYQVIPVDTNAVPVAPSSNYAVVSNFPYAVTITGTTYVSSSHITELRSAITGVRAATGLAPPSWSPLGTQPLNEEIEEMRAAFDGVANVLGLPAPVYVDGGSLQGVLIKKSHVQQIRAYARSYPEMIGVSAAFSQPIFSPNADGAKDSTTVTATAVLSGASQRTDFRWLLNIRNSASAVVRSANFTGTPFSFVWDGRNSSGAVQPDGAYTFEFIDLDALSFVSGSGVVTIDNTPPSAAIASPPAGFVASNVRSNGGTSFTVTGNTTDANFANWTLEQTGNGQPAATIGTGTTAIPTTTTLGTWSTGSLPNGIYTLQLIAADAASNTTVSPVNVTLGHFSASQDVHQIKAVNGERVKYTSIIPFPLTEVLTIRSSAGQTVKTLVNGSRVAGTYDDFWDGTNDAGQIVPDGPYRYFATATEGSSTLTWDVSNQMAATGGGATSLEYPQCLDKDGNWIACDSAPSRFVFDPYAGKPLRIRYCVGSGHPENCGPSGPAWVIVKLSSTEPTSNDCGECISAQYEAAGVHELQWFGLSTTPRLGVIRHTNLIPRNLTVVYGAPVSVTISSISPIIFYPGSSNATQKYVLSVGAYGARQVTLTAQFRHVESGSILRTITFGPVAPPGPHTIQWDGRADNGAWVAPGAYTVTITATDSAGCSAAVSPQTTVRY